MTTRSKLAQAAIKEATPFGAVLHMALVEKLALAHVALWLSQQDEGTSSAAVLATANQAIADITTFYN